MPVGPPSGVPARGSHAGRCDDGQPAVAPPPRAAAGVAFTTASPNHPPHSPPNPPYRHSRGRRASSVGGCTRPWRHEPRVHPPPPPSPAPDAERPLRLCCIGTHPSANWPMAAAPPRPRFSDRLWLPRDMEPPANPSLVHGSPPPQPRHPALRRVCSSGRDEQYLGAAATATAGGRALM